MHSVLEGVVTWDYQSLGLIYRQAILQTTLLVGVNEAEIKSNSYTILFEFALHTHVDNL